jgi:hypothetical protein
MQRKKTLPVIRGNAFASAVNRSACGVLTSSGRNAAERWHIAALSAKPIFPLLNDKCCVAALGVAIM